jgi:hypothetical protein
MFRNLDDITVPLLVQVLEFVFHRVSFLGVAFLFRCRDGFFSSNLRSQLKSVSFASCVIPIPGVSMLRPPSLVPVPVHEVSANGDIARTPTASGPWIPRPVLTVTANSP